MNEVQKMAIDCVMTLSQMKFENIEKTKEEFLKDYPDSNEAILKFIDEAIKVALKIKTDKLKKSMN